MNQKSRSSINSLYEAWSSWANTLPEGESFRDGGLAVGWMGGNSPMSNQILVDQEIRNVEELDGLIDRAKEFGDSKNKGWIFNVCADTLKGISEDTLKHRCTTHGLALVGVTTGMEVEASMRKTMEPPFDTPPPILQLKPQGKKLDAELGLEEVCDFYMFLPKQFLPS